MDNEVCGVVIIETKDCAKHELKLFSLDDIHTIIYYLNSKHDIKYYGSYIKYDDISGYSIRYVDKTESKKLIDTISIVNNNIAEFVINNLSKKFELETEKLRNNDDVEEIIIKVYEVIK